MASLDLNADYKKAQDKITATKAFTELKSDYKKTRKKSGESFEKAKSDVTSSLNSVKEKTKSFEKQIKNQA